METVTYMLGGTVEHGDNIGNTGTIGPGDIQWKTAGRGVIHQEMPNSARICSIEVLSSCFASDCAVTLREKKQKNTIPTKKWNFIFSALGHPKIISSRRGG